MRMLRTMLTAAMLMSVFSGMLPAAEQLPLDRHEQTRPAGKHSREHRLGPCTLGASEDHVRKELGTMSEIGTPGVSVAGSWSAWIDQKTRTLKGISYEERKGIRAGQSYPATGRGIAIGSTDDEVVKAYGRPEQTFTGKTSFLLRNSELGYIFVYPSRGMWITLTNQRPYADQADWRVTLIAIGDAEVIDTMLHSASAFAMRPITRERKNFTRSEYKDKFGNDKDLEIYDDYQYNLQEILFELVRSKGPYMILPATVIPQDEEKAQQLYSELAPASPLVKAMDSTAREKTLVRYAIPSVRFDTILQNVNKLRSILFRRDIEENNRAVMKGLQKNSTDRK